VAEIAPLSNTKGAETKDTEEANPRNSQPEGREHEVNSSVEPAKTEDEQ